MQFSRSIVLSSIIALVALTFSGNGLHAQETLVTGRLIVELREDQNRIANLASLQGDVKSTNSIDHSLWATANGLRSRRILSQRLHLMELPETNSSRLAPENLQFLARRLAMKKEVISASVEYKRFPLVEPNDPLYRGDGAVQGDQSYFYEGDFSIRAPGAWDITTGSENSVIAIVDTGVLADHPELRNRAVPSVGYDFVSSDQPGDFTSANDGDGRDADPTDPGDHCMSNPSSWHGTGVASVAAANSNDGEGMAGVDWKARLLHVRALGRCGGTDADIIDSIRWSAGLPVSGIPLNETPATVINLSIGGPTECTPAWQDVIDELNELDIPFVIAAGNEATNALRSSPANCADVITVGANTPGGDIDSGFSNYGLKVTVTAPGRNIQMADNAGLQGVDVLADTYARETGSSFSAALVSGAISLMNSLNADLNPAAVRAILQQSITEFSSNGDCESYYCGGGILNLARAMQVTRDGDFDETINTESQIVSAQSRTLNTTESVSASLLGYRDVHYYRIAVDQIGMLVIESDADADLFGYLLNDKFSVLALDDDNGSALNFKVASRVEPGNYYVAVERSLNRRNDDETAYAMTAELVTDQPDAFTFQPIINAALNSPVASEVVRISGLTDNAIITVAGGFYSINGAAYTSDQGSVSNGDDIVVSLQSPPATSSSARLTLTVGAYATDFTVTTADFELLPAAPQAASSGCAIHGSGHLDPLLLILLLASLAASVRSATRNRL